MRNCIIVPLVCARAKIRSPGLVFAGELSLGVSPSFSFFSPPVSFYRYRIAAFRVSSPGSPASFPLANVGLVDQTHFQTSSPSPTNRRVPPKSLEKSILLSAIPRRTKKVWISQRYHIVVPLRKLSICFVGFKKPILPSLELLYICHIKSNIVIIIFYIFHVWYKMI